MSNFRYNVIDQSGKPFRGTLTAEDQGAAMVRLQAMNYYVLSVEEDKGRGGNLGEWWLEHVQKVKQSELVIFSRQFATMVNAGIGIIKCLDILQNQTKDRKLARVIQVAEKDVASGESLTEAFSRHKRVFSSLYVSMLRAAEAGGILDDILTRLADYLENDQELRGKVKSAMVYPAVVLLFAIAVVNILVFFILPKFSEIFQQIGIDLPTSTRLLLSVSRFMAHHWYLGPAMVAAGIFGLRFYRATPQGRRNVDWVLLKLPIAGDIILKVAVARFTRTLGTLTSSGLPVMHALEIVADTAGNQVISDAIHSAKRSVREGEGISDPLVVTGIFPPMVTQMIAVGEETGALDEMLVKVSQFYEAEVDRTLKALTSLIEPLMIIGLGLLVAFVAISVISPIYEMVGNASKL